MFVFFPGVCGEREFLPAKTVPCGHPLQELKSQNPAHDHFKKIGSGSALSGALFEIENPAGNCPEYRHGLFGLEMIPGLGEYTIIIL